MQLDDLNSEDGLGLLCHTHEHMCVMTANVAAASVCVNRPQYIEGMMQDHEMLHRELQPNHT